jgi:hypothetical protein
MMAYIAMQMRTNGPTVLRAHVPPPTTVVRPRPLRIPLPAFLPFPALPLHALPLPSVPLPAVPFSLPLSSAPVTQQPAAAVRKRRRFARIFEREGLPKKHKRNFSDGKQKKKKQKLQPVNG